jgi:hypothetical protein
VQYLKSTEGKAADFEGPGCPGTREVCRREGPGGRKHRGLGRRGASMLGKGLGVKTPGVKSPVGEGKLPGYVLRGRSHKGGRTRRGPKVLGASHAGKAPK